MSRRYKHGGYSGGREAPEHYIWRSMISRCTNPNDSSYKEYGGRGITVCNRWLVYQNFLADMGGRPSVDLSIERKNVNDGYHKGNCEWASRSDQQKNKTSTRHYFNGYLVLTLVEAASLLGISKELAYWRMKTWGTFEKGAIWHELQKEL